MTDEKKPQVMPFAFELSYELYDARGERLRDVLLREHPGSGQMLQLDIVNVLQDKSIRFNRLSPAQIQQGRFHFHLHFPAGALADRTVGVVGQDWLLRQVGTDLYLAWGSPTVTLSPRDRLIVQLHGVSAAPSSGLKVDLELAWPTPDVEGRNDADLSIPGRAPGGGDYKRDHTLPLGVLDRRGRPDSPLRARFVGSNQVLNVDNRESSLTLRLFNSAPRSRSQEVLRFRYDANQTDLSSRLVVALPVGTSEHQPWALGTEDQVNGVVIALEGWSVSPPKRSTDGDRVEWELTPTRDVDLPPQGYLNVTLSQLKTGHPSGPADLELRYRGVTGYWDGEIVCAIEKAPLVFGRGDKKDSVGIGDSDPDSRLCVEGGHLRLNGGEIQHGGGALVFRSDADSSNETFAAKFFKKEELLLDLSSKGHLRLNGGEYQHRGTLVFRSNHTVAAQFLKKDEQAPLLELSSDGALELKKGRFRDKTGFVIPVGTIVAFGGEQAPAGWLMCQGQEVSRTQYADLFQAIGTSYGSAPSDKFKIPELKARVPIGSDSNYRIGTTGGEPSVQLTEAHMPSHTHNVQDPGHSHNLKVLRTSGYGISKKPEIEKDLRTEDYSTEAASTGIRIDPAGGNQRHNNMQPYTVVNYIIKH